LKLSPLLHQFLFENKYLKLAGIGKFTIEESGFIAEDLKNPTKGGPQVKINFVQDSSLKEDETLINFISTQSGKMKSLTASDLDSNMELARQFLNIGKPFLLEGIGTLNKNKSGNLEFVQNQVSNDKSKDTVQEGADVTSTTENSFTDYEEMFSRKKPQTPGRKKLLTSLILFSGIALAVLGGYYLYNKSKKTDDKNNIVEETKPQTQPETKQLDTFIKKELLPVSTTSAADKFRFIIERAYKERALKRYNDLKSYGLNVKMTTSYSVVFKIFFELPALAADTARIRDSLQLIYGTRGKTRVESLN
jgi:hypothetical protein